ncbi:class I SAM-dependent methyltransferase [Chengkuizengella axinellae]|uniref:Methyltransferase domain-containing protein n=1 Tax=Chengkuizengella axinellae TaxID=3064388 RepID=A0ABT9J669_9BACL|nr:methyltransferase domain-containing protein [Chengkuizengella sp. 2205SS18-9]MDP5277118.1 methyltransferase domain-containing protein [Chengkuizengella sp. 2205SS18-9]
MGQMKSTTSLFDSAIESANIFNWVVAETSITSGLLICLYEFRTVEEIIEKMDFLIEKKEQLKALLNVLVDQEFLETKTIFNQKVFRTKQDVVENNLNVDNTLNVYKENTDKLKPWFSNVDNFTQLIRKGNHELLGHDLSYFRSETKRIRFDKSFLSVWQTNLSNPLYEFGRMQAVNELVRKGSRFLDLASGLGYGSQRISQLSDERCDIYCIDKSLDFLNEAKMLIYPNARVNFIHRDLNDGLPPNLPSLYFDGVLFNGAFHFIKDKRKMLKQIYKALRSEGLLVIGHCFSRSDFEDEHMHDFYFSMIENESWIVSWSEIKSLVEEVGFVITNEYYRGSHSYLLAEKLPDSILSKEDFI